ncbi:MAG: alkaline phosphatase family protein [Candidatus Tumulicola sp.]
MRTFTLYTVGCLLVALTGVGCSQSSNLPVAHRTEAFSSQAYREVSSSPIKHVVVIIQENRSFDNIFAGFPGADAPTYGYMNNGKRVNFERKKLATTIDLRHSYQEGLIDYDNGRMDGFNLNLPGKPEYPYSYVNRSDVKPYWDMAEQYTLADHMFPTELGGSFTAHLNLIAGTDKLSSTVAEGNQPSNTPWGCDAPPSTTTETVGPDRKIKIGGSFPCFTQFKTMADIMDPSGVSWKYYAPQTIGCPTNCNPGGLLWSEFDAIKHIRYGRDWARNIINPQTQILNDVANGNLASISWVVPDAGDSDHAAGTNTDRGPSWVAAIVNAIGESSYWKSTAIIVLWDDWGGWYDDVPPPQLDWLGLGVRVPCIIISPYAKVGYVSHTQYESGSTLKFMEEVFNLPSLGATDARANSLDDSFDFKQKPTPFKPIHAKYPPPNFWTEKPSRMPPDTE